MIADEKTQLLALLKHQRAIAKLAHHGPCQYGHSHHNASRLIVHAVFSLRRIQIVHGRHKLGPCHLDRSNRSDQDKSTMLRLHTGM